MPTVSESILAWLDLLWVQCRPSTVAMARSCAGRWTRAFGARVVSELRPRDLMAFLAARKAQVALATVVKELRVLRWFLRWAWQQGTTPIDLCGALPRFRTPPRPPRVLSPGECERLVEACHPRLLRPMVVVAIETGLRRGTLLALLWEHVDLAAGWLSIPGEFLKSGRNYSAPITTVAIEALRAAPRFLRAPERVFPYHPQTIRGRWVRAREAAGFPGLRFHDLRKTFLTACRRRGVQLEVAMALSDHHDVKICLSVYRAVSDEELLRAVGRVPCGTRGLHP